VIVVGCWLLVVGCWLLVVGCWLLVVGCWLLVVGCFAPPELMKRCCNVLQRLHSSGVFVMFTFYLLSFILSVNLTENLGF